MPLLNKKQIDELLRTKVKLENHWWTLDSAIEEAKKIGVDLDYSGRKELIASIDSILFNDIQNDADAYNKIQSKGVKHFVNIIL